MEPSGSGAQLPTTTCYRATTLTSSSSSSCISQGSTLSLSHVASRILSSGGPSSTTPMIGEAGGSGLARIGASLSSRLNFPEAGSISTGLNPSGAMAASSSLSPSSSSYMVKAKGSSSGSMAAPQPINRPGSQQGCVSSILSSPALSLSIPGSSGIGSSGLASPYGMPSPTTTTGPHGQPQHVSPHHLSPGDSGPSGISTTSSTSSSSSSTTPHGQQQQTFRDTSTLGE